MSLWSLFAKFSPNLIEKPYNSFEDPGNAFQPAAYPPGIMPLKPNDPHLPGWTALGTQEVAVLWMSDKADGGTLKAADGSLFLDLSGYSTQATAVPNVGNVFGGVRLTRPISTEPNARYLLSFALGTYEDDPVDKQKCGPTGVLAIVESAAVYKRGFIHPRNQNAKMFWTRHEYVFRANSAQTSLTIWALDMKQERTAAGANSQSSLIGIDDVGIRKMTVIARILVLMTTLLHLLQIKVPPPRQFDPQLPRP